MKRQVVPQYRSPLARIAAFAAALIVIAGAGPTHAQDSSSAAHVWYEGDLRHEVYLQRDLVADFGSASSHQSNQPGGGGLQKLGGDVIKRQGGVRILKVSGNALQKASTGELGSAQSQVFSDSSGGGALRALPGGVIVTFDEEKSETDLRVWAAANGLEFDHVLPIESGRTASFKTPPGLASLETANRVRALDGVEAAQPNWWVEKWSGPDPAAANLSPRQARDARRSASERFKEADFNEAK